jgi:hypothetical protein
MKFQVQINSEFFQPVPKGCAAFNMKRTVSIVFQQKANLSRCSISIQFHHHHHTLLKIVIVYETTIQCKC